MLTYWLSTLLELDSSRENRDSHWLWLEAATQFAKLLRVCVVSSMQTTQVYRNVASCYLFKAKNELLAEIINTDHIYLNLDIHSHLRKLISALAFLSESTNFPPLHIRWNDLSSPASSYFSYKCIIPNNYSMTGYSYNNLFVYSLS